MDIDDASSVSNEQRIEIFRYRAGNELWNQLDEIDRPQWNPQKHDVSRHTVVYATVVHFLFTDHLFFVPMVVLLRFLEVILPYDRAEKRQNKHTKKQRQRDRAKFAFAVVFVM